MKFRIIFRFTDEGLAGRSIDFPELVATGRSVQEVENQLFDAIQERIEAAQAEHKWKELFEPRNPAADGPNPKVNRRTDLTMMPK